MKLKSFLFLCFMSLFASAFANNQHEHPKAHSTEVKRTQKSVTWPGPCEIEIINRSYDIVQVYGEFDDGEWLRFNIPPYDAPHRISLYYYGYCHYDMFLSIDTLSGYRVYTGYPAVRTIIEVFPYLANQLKAEIKAK
ncbi:hypothetical protein [Legionella nagasakiensis]|uniref:hypothetical protein n=1 Tax=Legionella nagasakiensis TaxID=535290 RepID=UPI00105688C1|nr:hypothetical protein [Legionella nagasakiensis]